MSVARVLLRRYREQRRDLGESEFALDTMDIDAALAMIANAKSAPPSAAAASPAARDASPVAKPATGPEGDWRAALAGSGLAPASPLARAPGPSAPPPAAPPVVPPTPVPPEPPAPTMSAMPTPKPGDKRFAFQEPSKDDGASSEAATAGIEEALDGLIVGQAGGSALEGAVAAATSIDDIARLVAACAACGLGATKHRDVVGEGDPNADFVVVGEAPGEQEDLSGRPFVGASGQLLTKILAAINLPREQVYICNVIKHRPPGNRNPTPAEVAACSPFLLRQLELVKPKVILAVGTFAAQTLLRTKEPIGKLRGRVHRYYGVPLVVTYHPAALLRNPSWKRPTWDDVQLARRILDRAPRA